MPFSLIFVRFRLLSVFALALAFALFLSGGAFAQDLMPAQAENATTYELSPGDATHPMMRLTPDKSEILRLETNVKSIVVGNFDHLNILMDTPKTLILVGREPGATQFTLLDAKGKVIMQRYVIVASPKEKYVRIRRSCANAGDEDCTEISVFYCPDMCHRITVNPVPDKFARKAAAAAANAKGSGGGSQTAGIPSSLPVSGE